MSEFRAVESLCPLTERPHEWREAPGWCAVPRLLPHSTDEETEFCEKEQLGSQDQRSHGIGV